MLQSIPQVIIKNNLKDIQQKQHEVYNANADTDADKKLQPDNTPVLINNNLPVYGTMNAIAAIQLIIKEIPAIKEKFESYSNEDIYTSEIEIKYVGYIRKEKEQVEKQKRFVNLINDYLWLRIFYIILKIS